MKKNVVLFSLIFLMFVLTSSFQSLEIFTNINNSPVKTSSSLSQVIIHAPIEINGNEDFASQALAEGWPGNGSQHNPYRISGLNITSYPPVAINISNIDCYFSIDNCLIRKIHFTNVTHGQITQNTIYWLSMLNSSLNTITDNLLDNIYDQSSGTNYYISLTSSSSNIISLNTVDRIILSQSSENIIIGNQLTYGLYINSDHLESCIQTEVTNNFINGKPLIYWQNETNKTISTEAGQIILVNCSAITISNQNLTFTVISCYFNQNLKIYNNSIKSGIDLYCSINSVISNNTIKESWIYLIDSTNNTFKNNIINKTYIYCDFSFYNYFINNTIIQPPWSIMWQYPAITAVSSGYNTFINNIIKEAEIGIALYSSANNTITHTSCSDSSIYLQDSTGNSIIDNNLSYINIVESSSNIINDNQLNKRFYLAGDTVESCLQTEVINNTINGEPVLFWQNRVNETVPVGMVYIILINCSRITISHQVNCYIFIRFSQQLKIYNNSATNSYSGIYLLNSLDCIIHDNSFINSSCNMLEIRESSKCNIFNNTISTGTGYGIFLWNSSYCNFGDNSIVYNDYGLVIYYSSNNKITNNIIRENGYYYYSHHYGDGMVLWHSSNNIITDNSISKNVDDGIRLEDSSNNIIKRNLINENGEYGLFLSDSSNNTIYLNSFIDNNLDYPDRNSQANDYKNAGFDNNFFANYWSDWMGPDMNNDGIVDLPYTIYYESNQDAFPLIYPPSSQFRILIPPQIIVPNGREILKESFTIAWVPAFDTQDHSVVYAVYYSADSGSSWILLAENLIVTEFIWDVSALPSGSAYLIKVQAIFSDGATVMDLSDEPFFILNSVTSSTSTASTQPSSFPPLSVVLLAGLFLDLRRKLYKRGK